MGSNWHLNSGGRVRRPEQAAPASWAAVLPRAEQPVLHPSSAVAPSDRGARRKMYPAGGGTPKTIPAGEAHVWTTVLEVPETELGRLAALLSPEELERARRFRFECHRNRFVVGRGRLREILAAYLDTSPVEIEFTYGDSGKPELATPFAASGLRFNLSHSEALALVAVTRAAEIGVDVERVRVLSEADDLVKRFFSASEAAAYAALPAAEKPAAFFNLWTRKEAWLKATGQGIAHALHLVEVSFLPGEAACLRHLPPQLGAKDAWSLHHLLPSPGFTAALAVKVHDVVVSSWRLTADA